MAGATFATIFMFLWTVEIGELGVLTFFGFDTGIRYESGHYILPNALPFLREIRLVIGFGLTVIGRNTHREVHHHRDDRYKHYTVDLKTTSFIKTNLDKALTDFIRWLTTFTGRDGEIEYYRVGRLLYLVLIVAAHIGSLVSPRVQPESFMFSQLIPSWFSQKSINTASPAAPERVEVIVNLQEAPLPVIPEKEFFTPIIEKGGGSVYDKIDDVKYFYYRYKPEIDGSVSVIKNTSCFVVPANKKMYFFTDLSPVVAINMKNSVTYSKKPEGVPLWRKGIRLFGGWEDPNKSTYIMRGTWVELFQEWTSVKKDEYIEAQALPYSEIPDGILGGIVCF